MLNMCIVRFTDEGMYLLDSHTLTSNKTSAQQFITKASARRAAYNCQATHAGYDEFVIEQV